MMDDRKHIKEGSNPRLGETVFRSPQLTLFDLGPNEWLLYWKAPSYTLRRRKPSGGKVIQLALDSSKNNGINLSRPRLDGIVPFAMKGVWQDGKRRHLFIEHFPTATAPFRLDFPF